MTTPWPACLSVVECVLGVLMCGGPPACVSGSAGSFKRIPRPADPNSYGRSESLRVARQHRINSRDEGMELRDVVLEELPYRFVADLPVLADEATLELDVRSIEFICGELQNARMLRRCCWAIAVPIFPGDVPMKADGFRVNAFLPDGRLAQSIAFFRPPGIERLYRA